jgi:hypothetical protein
MTSRAASRTCTISSRTDRTRIAARPLTSIVTIGLQNKLSRTRVLPGTESGDLGAFWAPRSEVREAWREAKCAHVIVFAKVLC